MGFFGPSRATPRDGTHQRFTPAQLRAARTRELKAESARKEAVLRRQSRNIGNPRAKSWIW